MKLLAKMLLTVLAIILMMSIITNATDDGVLGRLPGDFVYELENFTLYIPITTSLIMSVLFFIFYMIWRFF